VAEVKLRGVPKHVLRMCKREGGTEEGKKEIQNTILYVI
jgi:hypothetical protein